MRAKIIDRWQHRNVMADIRKMLESLELTTAEFSAAVPYTSGNGTVKERGRVFGSL
jgi:hypothetical protein